MGTITGGAAVFNRAILPCAAAHFLPSTGAMASENIEKLYSAVRDVPDFPKPGIIFKDITPILGDPSLLRLAVDSFIEATAGKRIDKIIGIDARGFLFAAAVAYKIGAGIVPIRKKGKLPYKTLSTAYKLEYGEAAVEVHVDAIKPGEKILLIDDLLATGGTSAAALELVRQIGGEVVEAQFLIELEFLGGRKHLEPIPVRSFLRY